MKKLLRQFRISSALDAKAPLPPPTQTGINRSKELRDFQVALTALDRQLRQTPPPVPPLPAAAHDAILRALKQQAGPGRSPATAAWRWGWAVAGALPVLVLAAGWLLREPTPPNQPPVVASTRWPTAVPATIPDQMSAAVLGPLTREWHGVRADVAQTVEFLLASIP